MILLREREQERDRVGILLVFRIQAVGLLMTKLQTLRGIVHDESDQDKGDDTYKR